MSKISDLVTEYAIAAGYFSKELTLEEARVRLREMPLNQMADI
jgi:hypothetical protein